MPRGMGQGWTHGVHGLGGEEAELKVSRVLQIAHLGNGLVVLRLGQQQVPEAWDAPVLVELDQGQVVAHRRRLRAHARPRILDLYGNLLR